MLIFVFRERGIARVHFECYIKSRWIFISILADWQKGCTRSPLPHISKDLKKKILYIRLLLSYEWQSEGARLSQCLLVTSIAMKMAYSFPILMVCGDMRHQTPQVKAIAKCRHRTGIHGRRMKRKINSSLTMTFKFYRLRWLDLLAEEFFFLKKNAKHIDGSIFNTFFSIDLQKL